MIELIATITMYFVIFSILMLVLFSIPIICMIIEKMVIKKKKETENKKNIGEHR